MVQKDGDIIVNLGFHPMTPEIPSVIGTIENNSPASLAGLQIGDQILSVNDKNIDNWDSLVEKIQESPDNILKLKVNRFEKILDIILVPAMKASSDDKRLCWYISR